MVSLTLDALTAPLDRSLLHVFVDGSFHGTPEDALDIGAIYLQ